MKLNILMIKNRFKFCGFSDKETVKFINFTVSLYEFNDFTYDKSIIEYYYIMENENKKLLDNTLYKLIPGSNSKKMI